MTLWTAAVLLAASTTRVQCCMSAQKTLLLSHGRYRSASHTRLGRREDATRTRGLAGSVCPHGQG